MTATLIAARAAAAVLCAAALAVPALRAQAAGTGTGTGEPPGATRPARESTDGALPAPGAGAGAGAQANADAGAQADAGSDADARSDAVATADTEVLHGAIATALAALPEDVRVYNDHVVTLANPFMEGRLPGTRGMEIAKEYVEFWFRDAGLQPAFADEAAQDGGNPFRQPFPMAAVPVVRSQSLAAGAALPGGPGEIVATGDARAADALVLEPGTDFAALGVGASGAAAGPLVFVGYSIDDGPDGYASYAPDDDLTGSIALMLRFEPMDEGGKSLWAERGPWSGRAAFASKLRAAAARKPAAILIANTPGADDPRVHELLRVGGAGEQSIDVPVVLLSAGAAERLLRAVDPECPSLLELRRLADGLAPGDGGAVELGGAVQVQVDIERRTFMAENVGGLLPGRGALADDHVVIGAHLDHLGMGDFGSRSGAGELHPGADDNASGSAAVLMLARKLADSYAALPPGTPARTILFLCFSAEESGLNGSRHYVANPIAPLEDHALMINFDMIGRIRDDRLSVSGTHTAEGLSQWLQPHFAASPLTVVEPETLQGASDHTAFHARGIPVLFAIIADLHDDFHTPRDTSWRLNREGAVKTVHLFHDVALAAATRTEPFAFVEPEEGSRRAGPGGRAGAAAMPVARVRFGIVPELDSDARGVRVRSVSPGTAAAAAHIRAGDVLVRWDGDPITDVGAWMATLAEHAPGDVVQVGVLRDGAEITLPVTLRARADG